jgi:hypothetical protein
VLRYVSKTTYIVTLLVLLLQPLFGQEQPFAGALDLLLAGAAAPGETTRTTVLPGGPETGHSFYPDLFIGPDGPMRTLLVVPLSDLDVAAVPALLDLPRSIHILVTAPRNDPAADAIAVTDILSVDRSAAVVYLSRGESPRWRLAVEGEVTPAWIARAVITADSARFDPVPVNAARLGLGRRDPVLERALTDGQSAVRLEIPDYRQLPEAIIPFAAAVAENAQSDGRRYERNYLVLPSFSIPFRGVSTAPVVVIEAILVWSVVIVAALLVLYGVSRPRRVRRYSQAIAHNLALFLGLFLILLAGLVLANLAIRATGAFFSLEGLAHPLIVAKFAFAFVLLTPLYPTLHRRFRRSSSVYSGAALFLLILGSLIASIFSLILGVFFVLAFIFGFLFSLSHQAIVKSIFLLAAFAPGAYLLISIAGLADQGTIAAVLTPPIWRELVMVVLIMPLMLMFFRLDILVTRIPLLPILGMVSLTATAIAVAVIITRLGAPVSPAIVISETYPEPGGALVESVPESGEIRVSGTVGSDGVSLLRRGERVVQCDTLPCGAIVPAGIPPVAVSFEVGEALDRYTISYEITFRRPARGMEFSLRTNTSAQLYATDLPGNAFPGDTAGEFVFTPGPYPPPVVTGTIVLRNVELPNRVIAGVTARFAGEDLVPARDRIAPETTIRSHRAEWTVQAERQLR